MKYEGETYIGDGVYASFDGWHIKLRTLRDQGNHVIFLDPEVIRNLSAYTMEIAQKVKKDVPD